ncbi:hypothetical protein DMENIID0001_045810 [Sergentomyia squamirostris]
MAEVAEDFTIKNLIYTNYAKEVKKELMADLAGVFDDLSSSVFSPLADISMRDGESELDVESLAEEFKATMKKKIAKNFENMWESSGITHTLAALEYLRRETPEKSLQQWRPTGKSPKEQIRPYVIRDLQKKIVYLEKQHEYQSSLFNEYLPKLENAFDEINHLEANRTVVLDFIDVHQQQLQDDEDKIKNEISTVVNKVRE